MITTNEDWKDGTVLDEDEALVIVLVNCSLPFPEDCNDEDEYPELKIITYCCTVRELDKESQRKEPLTRLAEITAYVKSMLTKDFCARLFYEMRPGGPFAWMSDSDITLSDIDATLASITEDEQTIQELFVCHSITN